MSLRTLLIALVLVTATGYELLTSGLPRTTAEIERVMASAA